MSYTTYCDLLWPVIWLSSAFISPRPHDLSSSRNCAARRALTFLLDRKLLFFGPAFASVALPVRFCVALVWMASVGNAICQTWPLRPRQQNFRHPVQRIH
jgi:hypothetical protein